MQITIKGRKLFKNGQAVGEITGCAQSYGYKLSNGKEVRACFAYFADAVTAAKNAVGVA